MKVKRRSFLKGLAAACCSKPLDFTKTPDLSDLGNRPTLEEPKTDLKFVKGGPMASCAYPMYTSDIMCVLTRNEYAKIERTQKCLEN
jgi:hypothetical protein